MSFHCKKWPSARVLKLFPSFAIFVHTAPCCPTMSSLQRRFGLPIDLAPFICHSVLLIVHLLSFIRVMCPARFHFVLHSPFPFRLTKNQAKATTKTTKSNQKWGDLCIFAAKPPSNVQFDWVFFCAGIKVAIQTCYPDQSQYTDTRPTSPNNDPTTPGP